MTASLYTLLPGTTPLLIDVPHAGIYIPPELRASMTPIAQTVPDTDWHVHLLYQFALELGAGLMAATHSRYVIDLNRDPAGVALYQGADNTELCPTRTFANEDIYLPGEAPSEEKIGSRRANYWEPYHRALAEQIAAIRAAHGYAILLDGHSILSQVPRFFSGRLPDLNLGTVDGASCAQSLEEIAYAPLQGAGRFSAILNGRFKGGYITRHYGKPEEDVHALQLEIAQAAYMGETPPYAWNPHTAEPLITVLRQLVLALLEWRP
jgi:N-formylglutamate amidohydrolase